MNLPDCLLRRPVKNRPPAAPRRAVGALLLVVDQENPFWADPPLLPGMSLDQLVDLCVNVIST